MGVMGYKSLKVKKIILLIGCFLSLCLNCEAGGRKLPPPSIYYEKPVVCATVLDLSAIRFDNGTFYLYASVNGYSIYKSMDMIHGEWGCVVADSSTDSFVDRGILIDSMSIGIEQLIDSFYYEDREIPIFFGKGVSFCDIFASKLSISNDMTISTIPIVKKNR